MTELSPAAQAVYDAWYEAIDAYSECDPPPQLAAAFRALADAVVPEDGVFLSTASAARIRRDLLAIATELENTNEH
jgi:hypothetical protein